MLAFDGFVLDLNRGVLTAEAREVVLRPKTTAVLAPLLAHAGQVVPREALVTAVWGDLAVTDDSLTQCVSEIRRALGADAARMLETHARRGYRMATRPRPSRQRRPPPPGGRAGRRWSRDTPCGTAQGPERTGCGQACPPTSARSRSSPAWATPPPKPPSPI
ncbi:winged helix-turn-helix domain-containing protein [Sediminicoccus rosea]|uniref:Winged helix-turn-helix domain-containing protein n=1 Tax=Sediminicoccus rosea TaxID=1225128 RepID=A0ABZ0PFJ1_9PROT|nr:winged helix-turn-helix domain-containing protein [Sediminicoccus rosea]WPB84232.1 winged helix-turn-helix domain-containing protein [Sediminicoccus rosea]